MGAGASLTKDEAMAAAPDAGAEFSDAAWDELEKDAEGRVDCAALKSAAGKYAVKAEANGHGDAKADAPAAPATPRSMLAATKLQASARGRQERSSVL